MTLSIPQHLDATLLNNADMQGYVKAALHEPLFYSTDEGEAPPALAEAYEFVGDLTLRVQLRPGVKFHNGAEFKAADVKYTFDRILDPDVGSVLLSELEALKGVEVIDDLNVEFKLNQPYVPFPLVLSQIPIIPDGSGDQQKQDPVGAGPFRFKEWEEGVSITVERFEDYYLEDKPRIAGVRMVARSDNTAMRAGFEAGDLDVIALFAFTDVEPIRRAVPDATVLEYGQWSFIDVAFNSKRPPFEDVRVRRAFSLAVDKDALGLAMYGPNAAKLASFYVPDTHPLHPEGVGVYEHDPEAAFDLFREAGFEEGAELTILVPDLPTFRPSAPILQDGLAQAGISLKTPITPTGDWVDKVFTNRDYDATIWGSPGPPDPGLLITKYFRSGSASNFMQYANEELDELLAQAFATSDVADRRELYGRVVEHLQENVPSFPVVQPTGTVAFRGLDGLTTRPGLQWTWSEVVPV
jgi:peptide/nickel transport system substrate-binding protein